MHTPSKVHHSGDWVKGSSRRKGWELGCASCLLSPVHILFKRWDLIELVTPLQQQHHQLVYQRAICKLKGSPCFSSTCDIQQPNPKITSQVRQLEEKLLDLGGEQCTKQVSGTHCALISLLYSWLRAQNEPDTAPQSSSVSLDQVASSVLVHASTNPTLPSCTLLSELQHPPNFASTTALHITRNPCSTTGN